MPEHGPCTPWVTPEEVAECCDGFSEGSDVVLLEGPALGASQALWELSGRQYSGECSKAIRPCTPSASCYWVGGDWSWDGFHWHGDGSQGVHCGCSPLSAVELYDYPIRSVSEVLIDGEVVDPESYRLDDFTTLVRTRDADGNRRFWPSCQHMDAPSSEPGTFEVAITYGMDPPILGVMAAKELACQLARACGAANGTCSLPTGTTKVVRSGVTVEMPSFKSWAFSRENGWRSGLAEVDAFLAIYNPHGIREDAEIWSPDIAYPREVGTAGGS